MLVLISSSPQCASSSSGSLPAPLPAPQASSSWRPARSPPPHPPCSSSCRQPRSSQPPYASARRSSSACSRLAPYARARALHLLDTEALWLAPLRAEFLLCATRLGCLPALSSTARREVPTHKLPVGCAPPSARLSPSARDTHRACSCARSLARSLLRVAVSLCSPWPVPTRTAIISQLPTMRSPSLDFTARSLVRHPMLLHGWLMLLHRFALAAPMAGGFPCVARVPSSFAVTSCREVSSARVKFPRRVRQCSVADLTIVTGDSFACCRAHRFPYLVLAQLSARQRTHSDCSALIPIASSTSPRLSSSVVLVAVPYCAY
jgi:hypothetical protein